MMQKPLKIVNKKIYRGYNLIKQTDARKIFDCKKCIGFERQCLNSLAFLKYETNLEDKIGGAPTSKVALSNWVKRARQLYASHFAASPSNCILKILDESLVACGGIVSCDFFVRIVQRDLGLMAAICMGDTTSISSILGSDERLLYVKEALHRAGMYVAGMRDEASLEDCVELIVGSKKMKKVLKMLPDRIQAPRDLFGLFFSYISNASEATIVKYIVINFNVTIYKSKKESSVKEKLLSNLFRLVASGTEKEKKAQTALKNALLEARSKNLDLEKEIKVLKAQLDETHADYRSDSLDFCPPLPESDHSLSQNTVGSRTPPQQPILPSQPPIQLTQPYPYILPSQFHDHHSNFFVQPNYSPFEETFQPPYCNDFSQYLPYAPQSNHSSRFNPY